jgi:hypothetical protein
MMLMNAMHVFEKNHFWEIVLNNTKKNFIVNFKSRQPTELKFCFYFAFQNLEIFGM